MRRRFRFAAVALVMILGVPTAAEWLVSRTPEMESPPCQSCSSLYSSTGIETRDICDVPRGSNHSERIFRIRATFDNDAGSATLGGKECRRAVLTGLARPLRACTGSHKMLVMHSGLGTWYDGDVSVTVLGYYGVIGNPKSYHHGSEGFNIVCLEHTEPMGSTRRERTNYVLERLLGAFNSKAGEEE